MVQTYGDKNRHIKAGVRAVRTTNVALSATTGFVAVDGQTYAAGDADLSVLLIGQTAPAENGIYIQSATRWYRRDDADAAAALQLGTRVTVLNGTVGAGRVYEIRHDGTLVLGTDAIEFDRVGGPLWRDVLAADSQLDASVIGATTEAIHTGLTVPNELLNVARRRLHFRGHLVVDGSNSTDTWTVRVRLGGLTGVLLLAQTAFDIADNDDMWVEGDFYVQTTGASGKVGGFGAAHENNTPNDEPAAIDDQTLDLTADAVLVVTGECSTDNAGNLVSLKHFSAELYAS